MNTKKNTPIGVDAFFREIFAGDTVRDLDGKEYTVDERGYAKSLDGVTVTGFKRLKEPVFVKAAAQPEAPAKFQEKDGKVVPAVREALKPGPAPEAKPEPEPAPAARFIEGPAPHRGGRVNTSGFSQIGNLAKRFGMTTNEVRKICGDAGIEVVSHGPAHKAHIRVQDLPAVRKLLEEASGIGTPANNGNHRPNTTGYVTFANLARSLKCKAHVLRAFAGENGIPVVRPANKAHRNDGIYKEDEERFRDLWTEKNGPAAPAPVPVLLPDDLKRPVLATSDPAKVWSKFDAFLILEDQDLADELRRRGYEVTAIKHVEL